MPLMHTEGGASEDVEKIKRRTFLQHSLHALGTAGALSSSLAACALPFTRTKSSTAIQWISETDSHQSLDDLVYSFNQINSDGIMVNRPKAAVDHDKLLASLSQGAQAPDVLSLDVVWMRDFASLGLLEPLNAYWPEQERAQYLQVPLEVASYKGQVWGAPLHSDIGLLFYRTDMPDIIIPEDITSWDKLARMAQQAQESGKARWGFLWQAYNESLVCNFVEILSGYGGKIFDDELNPRRVLVDSSETVLALTRMRAWMNTISVDFTHTDHSYVTEDSEDISTAIWRSGDAAFMRNWPRAISDSRELEPTHVVERFAVQALPQQSSCLGGWQLAINKNSRYKDAAWTFINWMLQGDAQRYLAVNESFPVTLRAIYDDAYVQARNPFYASLEPIIEKNARFRPMLPHYEPEVTDIIRNIVRKTLTTPSYQPEQAVLDLANQLLPHLP